MEMLSWRKGDDPVGTWPEKEKKKQIQHCRNTTPDHI